MNSDHTFLTILFSLIDFVKEQTSPSKFHSTFGSDTFYYQKDFSMHNSFLNLRNYLQSIADVKNDSSRIALSNNDIYYDDLKYQLYTYEKVIELPTTGKLCHLKVFNVEELGNIFIKNSEKPVDHIYWICPPSNWCCGAECCRHYYKNPWPILGPELCVLLISAVVFASTLAILRLYRRWQQRQLGQETVSTTISLINSEHV